MPTLTFPVSHEFCRGQDGLVVHPGPCRGAKRAAKTIADAIEAPAAAEPRRAPRARKAAVPDVAEPKVAEPKRAPRARKASAAVPALPSAAKPVDIHELFNADDATIEKALRDVYEGKFGPYTTKVRVTIQRAGSRTDKRGRVRTIEPQIGVDGTIYDAKGSEIGHFSRDIAPATLYYQDGRVREEMWAHHGVVELNDTKHHGAGFGGAFNGRAIAWYRASGVHGISQDDHNGYVWASQGFSFRGDGAVPSYLTESIRELLDDLRAGKTKSNATKDAYHTIPKRFLNAPDLQQQIDAAQELYTRLHTLKPGDPKYPTAYEISQLGRREGQKGKTAVWLGKLLFVSADEMVLNPDEGRDVAP